MKHKYLLCFVLVCLLLYCYYKPVVEGIDPKDDTERYAFRTTDAYQDSGLLGGLMDLKKTEPECENPYKKPSEVINDAKDPTNSRLKDPTCFKDIKCTELLEAKPKALSKGLNTATKWMSKVPGVGSLAAGAINSVTNYTIVNVKGLEDTKDSENKDRKGYDILSTCIKGSKAEHKGIYYLANIDDNYLNFLIEGLFGACFIDLRSNIIQAFYYALDKVDDWTCDNDKLSIADKVTCHFMDMVDMFEYMVTAEDRIECGIKITKNDLARG